MSCFRITDAKTKQFIEDVWYPSDRGFKKGESVYIPYLPEFASSVFIRRIK